MLESIFRELILDHYRRPKNKGALEDPTVTVSMRNPLCGDEIELMLGIEDDRVAEVRFRGQGCSISQASASMMTEALAGRSLDDALALERRFLDLMHGDEGAQRDRALGDLQALQGVAKLPVRIKCALLGWNALDEAIRAYRASDRGLMGERLEFEDLTADVPEATSPPPGFDPTAHREELPD
ncbi:MAG: Fe-S cluster assembly sulfur transfer protein SufU [Gemmatimonadota bacterium]